MRLAQLTTQMAHLVGKVGQRHSGLTSNVSGLLVAVEAPLAVVVGARILAHIAMVLSIFLRQAWGKVELDRPRLSAQQQTIHGHTLSVVVGAVV